MGHTFNIIGGGHLGRVLGKVLGRDGGLVVQDVLTRSFATAQDAVAFIGSGRAVSDIDAMRGADFWLLAVNDDQIAPVAATLARLPVQDAVVFHCSGAKTAAELAPAAAQGALTASVHPVRSFADPFAVAESFTDTWCGIEGDARALAPLAEPLVAIGARTDEIDPAAKTVYPAASVFASNYLVTVLDAALRAYQAAGIPEEVAREIALPLATGTMENVFRLGPVKALSGPIARGDMATVARQQGAVEAWDAATGEMYRALAASTIELANKRRKDLP